MDQGAGLIAVEFIDHRDEHGNCVECGDIATVKLEIDGHRFYLCDVDWEDLINKLRGEG